MNASEIPPEYFFQLNRYLRTLSDLELATGIDVKLLRLRLNELREQGVEIPPVKGELASHEVT